MLLAAKHSSKVQLSLPGRLLQPQTFSPNLRISSLISTAYPQCTSSLLPTGGCCLTFPPLLASPPAPVFGPPAGLPGSLCWTSGSPPGETICSSGLCSAEVMEREVTASFSQFNKAMSLKTSLGNWWQKGQIPMKMKTRCGWNELADASSWLWCVIVCIAPPDRRVCTCLSRAILSHSRSCLLALSCRSSFLICSTCQAESRHRHRYSLSLRTVVRRCVSLVHRNHKLPRCGKMTVLKGPRFICKMSFLAWLHSVLFVKTFI